MVDYTFQIAARRLNARFQPKTVERHWDRIVDILSARRSSL